MAHAFADFIRQQMDERGLRNQDVVGASGLSRQLVSKYVRDDRDQLARLPEKETVNGFAKALHVSPDFMLGKAIESLGLGYSSGDFVNSVATATDAELLEEIERRLSERGGELADRSASTKGPDVGPADQPTRDGEVTPLRRSQLSEDSPNLGTPSPRVAKKRPSQKARKGDE